MDGGIYYVVFLRKSIAKTLVLNEKYLGKTNVSKTVDFKLMRIV